MKHKIRNINHKYDEHLESIRGANEVYPTRQDKVDRGDRKFRSMLTVCAAHGYTTTATLAAVLGISKGRARANIASWKRRNILRTVEITGLDPMHGLAPSGTASARALMPTLVNELAKKDRPMRTMNAQRIAQGAALIHHTLMVQHCAAHHARTQHDGATLCDSRYLPEAQVSGNDCTVIADALVGNDVVEVQRTIFSFHYMAQKVRQCVFIKQGSRVESITFYAAHGEVYEKMAEVINEEGYGLIVLAPIPPLPK